MPGLVLCGPFGLGGAGHEATLAALVRDLRAQNPDVGLTVVSGRPGRTGRVHGVRSIGRSDVVAIARALRSASGFLVAGGVFHDLNRGSDVRYTLGLMGLANALRRKVVLCGLGFGPLRSPLLRRLCHRLLDQADLILLPCASSREALEGLGVRRPPVKVTAYPCLSLGGDVGQSGAAPAGRPARGPVLGIAPRSSEEAASRVAMLARVADHLAANLDAEVALFPMCYPNDLVVCRAVLKAVRHPDRVTVHGRPIEGGELVEHVARFDLLLSMDLESMVLAAAAGVPTVPVSSEPWVAAFAEKVGLGPALHCESARAEDVLFRLETAWRDRDKLSRNILRATRPLAAAARDNASLALGALGEAGSAGGG